MVCQPESLVDHGLLELDVALLEKAVHQDDVGLDLGIPLVEGISLLFNKVVVDLAQLVVGLLVVGSTQPLIDIYGDLRSL